LTPVSQPLQGTALEAALNQLVALRHPEPHQLLGMHAVGGETVVRAFRPEAEAITVHADDGRQFPMAALGRGLFAVHLPGTDAFPYTLEVRYPQRSFTLRDPYAFWPTLGELDLHLLGEGRHQRPWERLGAHPLQHAGVEGTSFAVWAPTASSISLVGDFNGWDGRLHPMRRMGSSGVWELFLPEVGEGARYKFEVRPASGGPPMLKADPYAFRTEVPPNNASVVHRIDRYRWGDKDWLEARARRDVRQAPMSIYEVHLGSWRRVVEADDRPLTYRELAPLLVAYVRQLGFTHVELLPVAEHPFGGSWGYQVSNYYAPTARFGGPDDFRFLVDSLHQAGIGVLVDWVPAHFPRDIWALARFDGTPLYEYADPRRGEQPDWGTLVFNLARHEVRNFLVSNALFWAEQYHVDGLRVDAVASMLYLDYSRSAGQWVPNRWGGRENEEAIAFFREVNGTLAALHPDVVVIAEESTAWPQVTRPVKEGGLGFTFKWNMGWMHDTLRYFSLDPFFRAKNHTALTFGMMYAFSERFVLPLSHDEVVHMKGSLYGKMPGSPQQKLANLRALLAWMWAHPGRKLLFMGGEFGQPAEWNHDRSLDWHLLEEAEHLGVQSLVTNLNRLYRTLPALHALDDAPEGFQWIQADAANVNVFAFVRRAATPAEDLVVVANLAASPWNAYRVGFPGASAYRLALDTDARSYGGSSEAFSEIRTEAKPWDGQPVSAELFLPPLSVRWFQPTPVAEAETSRPDAPPGRSR
jgi:1,4-alpha-glucan branching enzyme